MLFSTVGQGPVFLLMAGAGLLIGALLSLSDALRSLTAAGFLTGLVIDLCFGVCAGFVFTAALLAADYGRFRLFALLGTLTGAALFRLGLDPPLRSAFRALRGLFRRILDKVSSHRLIKVIFK